MFCQSARQSVSPACMVGGEEGEAQSKGSHYVHKNPESGRATERGRKTGKRGRENEGGNVPRIIITQSHDRASHYRPNRYHRQRLHGQHDHSSQAVPNPTNTCWAMTCHAVGPCDWDQVPTRQHHCVVSSFRDPDCAPNGTRFPV